MKRLFLLLLAAYCLLPTAHSQVITGKVLQTGGKPLEFATVTLNKSADSSLITGTVTGENGEYEIKGIKSGTYFVKASMIGMNTAKSKIFEYKGNDKTIEVLSLAETSQQLSQFTVTAKKPVIEVKADKTILNVENTISSTGLSAFELLRKAPGVTIDNNDNISVKGKNGVKFQIDGRDVPLDSKELAAQLKGMQSSEIANIEIISNPSARFDAAGNAGIINIKMRRNRSYGTNGTAGAEFIQGVTPKIGINTSLNYREKKINLYGSYNNHYGNWHNSQNFDREQNGKFFDQAADAVYVSRWNSAKAGLDWFLSSKQTIGFLVNASTNPSEWNNVSRTAISDLSTIDHIDSTLWAENRYKGKRDNANFNTNYTFADTNGRRLSIDLNYGTYKLNGNSMQSSKYIGWDGSNIIQNKLYHSVTPTNIGITTLKADWEQKLWKGNFTAGIKTSGVKTDNTYDFYNIVENVESLDTNVSNSFDYNETINAAYVNYQFQWKKFNVQAGLRAENTSYKGVLKSSTAQNGETVEDNYTKLFPSAAITYMFTDKYGVNATYSRRIDRPSYQDLNPFEFKLDEMTYEKGNPRLKPQFTNSFELSSIIMGQPILTLGYSKTTDMFTQILDTAGHDASFIMMKNLADLENFSLGINIPTPIRKWWDGMISFSAYSSRFEAKFRDNFVVKDHYEAFNVYVEQTFRLPKGWSIQTSGWYNSKALQGTLMSEPQGAMDLAFQKKILNDRGDLKLRFGDILNTANWEMTNKYTPGLKMHGFGAWESRTITFNFNYRFGSNEIKSTRQRRTGLEDESRRIKAGRS
jgi:hypothetical protein